MKHSTAKLSLKLHDRERSKEAKAILQGLIKYNNAFDGHEDWRELTIAVKDARGKVVAGLNGHSDWGWLFVKLLWVSEEHRGSSLGKKLMKRTEAEARRRERLGYKRFGELTDYPKGYKRFFYTKRLSRK